MIVQEWVSVVRDVFQILFFSVVGTVTFLTYLKAKRTLLQPIKTEIFKKQIENFSDILSYFRGKTEFELRKDIYFDELLFVNFAYLLDIYISFFFGVEIEEVDICKRPYNLTECSSSMFLTDSLEKYLSIANDCFVDDVKKKLPVEKEKSQWNDYVYVEIKLPNKLVDSLKKLEKMMDSPLLPKALIILLEDYNQVIMSNIRLVQEILTDCAKELPAKYPAIETLEKASINWVRYNYNCKFTKLEDKAKRITTYIREYYAIDTLLD